MISAGEKWIEQSILQRALDIVMGDKVSDPLAALSTRERTIARMVAEGVRNKTIAAELGLTEGTVKVYLHKVYSKLDISNRLELALLVRN
jgi:two-component system nitrate/nitrite response regulator NarP